MYGINKLAVCSLSLHKVVCKLDDILAIQLDCAVRSLVCMIVASFVSLAHFTCSNHGISSMPLNLGKSHTPWPLHAEMAMIKLPQIAISLRRPWPPGLFLLLCKLVDKPGLTYKGLAV